MTQARADTGAPEQDEVSRITDVIVEQLGACDLEAGLTVVCGLAGQLVASLAEGQPGNVQRHVNSVAANIKRAAYAKLLHDDQVRRTDAAPSADT